MRFTLQPKHWLPPAVRRWPPAATSLTSLRWPSWSSRPVSTFGRLDAAFNHAGVQSPIAETADASGEEFDRVIATNLRGIWSCMKYELRQMQSQGSGAIVNT